MQTTLTMTNASSAYRKQGILTASPMELIVMLFDGLKKDLILARSAIEKNNPETAHKKLINAQNIVTELMNSLNPDIEMAEDLFDLYSYILRTLEEINMKKDASLIEPLFEIVSTLRDTWQEASEIVRSSGMPTLPKVMEG